MANVLKKQSDDTVQIVTPADDNVSKLEDIGTRLRANSKAYSETGTDLEGELIVIEWNEWRTMKLPPREKLIDPILPEKGLAEIFSDRGIGKTWLGLGMALSTAAGIDFLRWKISKPRRVLYVDGEMAFSDMQERAVEMAEAMGAKPLPGYLRLISADMQESGIPDLSDDDERGRKLIEDHLNLGTPEQVDILFLDNLSSLTDAGENDPDAWNVMKRWLLRLRQKGVTVVFFHHAGKTGNQRGTSKREDQLNTVIKLQKPKGYKEEDGARFEIHYPKHRGFYGVDAQPFEAQYHEGRWTFKMLNDDAMRQQVVELTKQGKSVRDIERITGIPRSSVNRLQKEARKLGLLPEEIDS